VVEPYCPPERRVTGFRDHLKAEKEFGPRGEGQHNRTYRVYFSTFTATFGTNPSANKSARNSFRKTRDAPVKAELDKLKAELERLPERWEFVSRSF